MPSDYEVIERFHDKYGQLLDLMGSKLRSQLNTECINILDDVKEGSYSFDFSEFILYNSNLGKSLKKKSK